MNSLDLNGPKIHAIYLVELQKIYEKMAWWHDAMQMMQWRMQQTNNSHDETRKNMEGTWSTSLGASQHSTTTRGSRPEI